MPRQSRSSRPAPRAAPAPAQQTRSAHTAAYPQQHAAPPQHASAPAPPVAAQATSSGPGMLAQMAATAGSVAVGSTIGHGLSSMLFGGSREAAPPVQEQPVAQQQTFQGARGCDFQAKEFTKCLEGGDVSSCNWYLEQLKACQSAAAPY